MKPRYAVGLLACVGIVAVLLAVIAGRAAPSVAQQAAKFAPAVVTDVHHDLSLPLSILSSQAVSRPDKPAAIDAINRILPNKHPDPKYLAAFKEAGVDPYDPRTDQSIQGVIGVPYAPNAMPPTLMNWRAHTNIDSYYPPDPVGDIGYDPVTRKKYYVQWVNVRYAVWDVTSGAPVMVISPTLANALWSGFGGPCQTQNSGDPIVLFDQLANRWFMSQFAVDAAPYYQCIVVSQTADPTGAWYRYAFQWDATKMNDYPHFGVWPDGYYMTTNQFNNGSTWGGAGVAVFERDQMLLGQTARLVKFDLYSASADFGGMLPSDWDGSAPPPAGAPNTFAEVDDNILSPALGADAMRLWKFHVDWTNTANSTFGVNGNPNYTLTVASFDATPCTVNAVRSCVPQLGTSVGLDVIGDRLMHRAAYRNINGHETLLINHTVNGGGDVAGIRWYEVRDLGTAPYIYQQSTYAPDSTYRWMGSIAMDHVGNIALGFSASDSTIYPAIRYAGRLASDPLNILAQGEATIINGTGAQTGPANRWGDYSALTLDPVDDCTFYYSQEYLETTGSTSWVTRVGSFRFPNCALGPQGTLAGTVTNSANSTPISGVQVKASSSPTQTFTAYTNLSGTYRLLIPVDTYTVNAAAYGFAPATVNGVSVVSGITTTQNVALTPAQAYEISGFVTDSSTGSPLPATVDVVGGPFNPPITFVSTDPATGFYSLTLAGSQPYTLTVSALLHTSEVRDLGALGANQTQNFALVATTPNGALFGYVKDYYTHLPLAGAQVSIQPGGQVTMTDTSGYFQMLNLAPGYYTATAALNLYSSVSIANIQIFTSNLTSVEFLLPHSQLNYAPAIVQKTLTYGQIVTDNVSLVISNTGLGALTYDLQEQTGGFTSLQPSAANFLVVLDDLLTTRAITIALTNLGYTYDVTTTTGFSALSQGALSAYLAVLYAGNNSGGTSLTQFTTYLDNGGRLLITGNDVGFYNGSSSFYTTYLQAAYVADDATSSNGNVVGEDTMAGLTGAISTDPYPDQYTINGANAIRIFHYSTTGPGNNGPAGSRIARNSYKAIYLPFRLYELGTSAVGEQIETNVMQRALGWLAGGSAFDAIPWLSESPISGTLVSGTAQPTQLVWNAGIAPITQPGVYSGSLKINNNDPNAQTASVPVALTVLPAVNQALLTGVVSTTGACDVNPAPISGAKVLLQGATGFTQTLTTSAAGQYGYWLATSGNPYAVTVSYPQHPTTSVSVSVAVGVTTTQNFTLRLQQPCLNVRPAALTATLNPGLSTTLPLTLSNSGAVSLTFNLAEAMTSNTGKDVLVVENDATMASAMESALAALGYTFDGVTDAQFQALTVNQLLAYRAVFHAGTTGSFGAAGAGETLLMSYLDAGGTLYISDHDLGYWRGASPFYSTYLQSTYVGDDALSKLVGSIVGEDILTGITSDISADPYPDYFNAGAQATPIFRYSTTGAGNNYPAGVRITRNGYKAVYTAFDFNYLASAAIQQSIIHSVMGFLGTTDIPWLSETPLAGTVAAAGNQAIVVTFDATKLVAGTYLGALWITNNDAAHRLVEVPVSLTVRWSYQVFLPIFIR